MATMVRGRGVTATAYEESKPDLVLIVTLGLLSALGILMVYSASAPRLEAAGLSPSSEMWRQVLFVAVGAVAFWGFSSFESRTVHTATPLVYAAILFSLLLIPLIGVGEGSVRWFAIGSYQIQPSEWAKPGLILALAAILAVSDDEGLANKRIFMAIAAILPPVFLIFKQPDLGTSLILVFIFFAMLFAAGITWRQTAGFAVGAMALGTLFYRLGFLGLGEYQLNRIRSVFNPDQADALGDGWQRLQSEIAIGQGGLTGQGLFEGTQTNLRFVPVQSTDFIFSAVGEQLGFLGGALVIALYGVLIWRLLVAANASPDTFGTLVCVGTAAFIGIHVFVNIGMTIGMPIPVTGLPLPFMSLGGSSMVAMAMSIGLAHGIWLRRSKVPARTARVL